MASEDTPTPHDVERANPDAQATPGIPDVPSGNSPNSGSTPTNPDGAPDPPAPAPSLQREFDRQVEAARSGGRLVGERQLIVGSGPLPVHGAVGGAVCLAADGAAVLVVALTSLEGPAASQIADQIDRIAQMSEAELLELGTESSREDLRTRHDALFPDAGSPPLNQKQRVRLLVSTRPSEAAWKSAIVELGQHLSSIHLLTPSGSLEEIEPPQRFRARSGSATATWSPLQWLGMVGLGIGIVFSAVAVWRALERPAPVIQTTQVRSVVQDVAVDVPGDATNANWIGQKRVFKTSDGALLVLFRDDDGVQIVQDHRNHGRSWRSPFMISELEADAFSAEIDGTDRLHLVSISESDVVYTLLESTEAGWRVVTELPLGEGAERVVDIAWDEEGQRAHVVWAEPDGEGEAPRWASISIDDDEAAIEQDEALAGPGAGATVLVNVAASKGTVTATYRQGDPSLGWYARTARWVDEAYEWAPPERLPVDSFFGAASLVKSGSFNHLILRDDTQNRLVYLRQRAGAGWSSPQSALQAENIEQIDFPVLSVDGSSGLMYVFFQSNALEPASQIQMVVRDPVAGWRGPYQTADPQAIPDGTAYPVTLSISRGEPLVLWTRGGGVPAIQAAKVSAP